MTFTMSITTVISQTVSTTKAVAPVLKLKSRTGIFIALKARLALQNEGVNMACAGASHRKG